MLFRDSSGDEEIQALRAPREPARPRGDGRVHRPAGRAIPADQVEPTAELLRTGLAGLALWWIDHPDVPKPVVLEAAARFTAGIFG